MRTFCFKFSLFKVLNFCETKETTFIVDKYIYLLKLRFDRAPRVNRDWAVGTDRADFPIA